MARKRVYIKPFKTVPEPSPVNSCYADWIEVTQDVMELGAVGQNLAVSDYDIGVFTNSNVSLKLRNSHGKYSDVGGINSIFGFRRCDSLVRVTWDAADWDNTPGSTPTEMLGYEQVVFEGYLNDDSTTMQLNSQVVAFNVLGYESILSRVVLTPDNGYLGPFGDVKDIIILLLSNVLPAPTLGVLSTGEIYHFDLTRINVGVNPIMDDTSGLINMTILDAINLLLQAANSVMYMDGITPVVSPRDPSSTVLANFYGQGSTAAPENIVNIEDIRSGMNRCFNYIVWGQVPYFEQDEDSVYQNGLRKKDVSFSGISAYAQISYVIHAVLMEFRNPMQEFKLTTPLTYTAINLPLLGKVSIDYPLVPLTDSRTAEAMYETGVYEASLYEQEINSFQVLPTEFYKVIAKEIDLQNNLAKFVLRKIE